MSPEARSFLIVRITGEHKVSLAALGFAYLKLRSPGKSVEAYARGVAAGDSSAETRRLYVIALQENAQARDDVTDAVTDGATL